MPPPPPPPVVLAWVFRFKIRTSCKGLETGLYFFSEIFRWILKTGLFRHVSGCLNIKHAVAHFKRSATCFKRRHAVECLKYEAAHPNTWPSVSNCRHTATFWLSDTVMMSKSATVKSILFIFLCCKPLNT